MKTAITKLDAAAYVDELRSALELHADAEYAVQMKAYLRNKFEFFGMRSPVRKVIFKEFFEKQGIPSVAKLDKTVGLLLDEREREFHYFAVDIARKHRPSWTAGSADLFETLATRQSWWDTVDYVRGECLKDFFRMFPDTRAPVTRRWLNSGNIWLQRLSVTFQIGYKEETDTGLLAKNIDAVKDSDEFFIQKAIGWALRDYGRTDPEFVVSFVEGRQLKPLSRREALRRIDLS